MERKIPRQEVAVAERVVRRAVFELVEELAPALPAEAVAQTYAFATGSFCRGAPESSDVDMLIVLPPGLQAQDCGDFQRRLLTRLLRRDGLLLDEMDPTAAPHRAHPSRTSWMGLCRVPGFGGDARRIDVKVRGGGAGGVMHVHETQSDARPSCSHFHTHPPTLTQIYAREHVTFAVNYFANSQSFCRATRLWAQKHCAEAARAHGASVTGFRLSDQSLASVLASGGLLAPVPCDDETALFRTLGLHYVPNTMRFLGMDYF